MAKLENGRFAVSVEEGRAVVAGPQAHSGAAHQLYPLRLTAAKLLINVGLLNLREEEIRLYRVRDLRLTQTLADRLFGVGTICVESVDASMPHVHLKHVKNPARSRRCSRPVWEEPPPQRHPRHRDRERAHGPRGRRSAHRGRGAVPGRGPEWGGRPAGMNPGRTATKAGLHSGAFRLAARPDFLWGEEQRSARQGVQHRLGDGRALGPRGLGVGAGLQPSCGLLTKPVSSSTAGQMLERVT